MSLRIIHQIPLIPLIPLLILACILIGCGGKQEQPVREPVRLNLVFEADKGVNPNAKGRASPLAVKVYELKSTGAFEEMDYFALQTDAKGVLGEDLLPKKDAFVIKPGARKEIRREASSGITALGIIAGYRNIDGATWQAIHPVPLPPEEGWFSSPVEVRLTIRLLESDIELVPQR